MSKSKKKELSTKQVVLFDHLAVTRQEINEVIYENLKLLGYSFLDLRITKNLIPPDTDIVGFITSRLGHDPLVQKLQKEGCKVIRIGSFPNEEYDNEIPAILPDFTEAGILAANHFADRQFENVGFIGNYPWGNPTYLYDGFRNQALKRGCECHLLQLRNPKVKLSGVELFQYRTEQILKWFKDLPKPIGLFTYSDINAGLLYYTATYGKYAVPEDIAILGLGNDTLTCDYLPVKLSSVDLNYKEHGRIGFNIFESLIKRKKIPTSPVFISPKGIVSRQSTNLLAVPDPVTARALRFIWDHFTEQISIDDAASATGVSRRTITRKFSHHLARSIYSEIHRKRIELSKRLLLNNQLKIKEVAAQAGFESPAYFNKVFIKAMGMTPGAYRKKLNNK